MNKITKPCAIIFGKGPSFDPTILHDLNFSHVVGLNHAILPVLSHREDAWLVFKDSSVARDLAPHRGRIGSVWCHHRYRNDFNYPTTYEYFTDNWETIDPVDSLGLCYNTFYSASAALWLLWQLGCHTIYTNGIGDEGRVYHPMFSGTPQTCGKPCLELMQNICHTKGMELFSIRPVK